MAIAAKKRRTATKKAAPKRRKRVGVAALAQTVSIGGVNFKKNTCHKTKTDAQKAAERARGTGRKARVLKSGTGFCVYTRGRARKAS